MTDLPDNGYFPVSQSRPEWSFAMIETHGPAGAWGRKAGPCRAHVAQRWHGLIGAYLRAIREGRRHDVARTRRWRRPAGRPAARTGPRLRRPSTRRGRDYPPVAAAVRIVARSEVIKSDSCLTHDCGRHGAGRSRPIFVWRLVLCSPQHSFQLGTPIFFPHQSSPTPRSIEAGPTPAPAGSVPRGFRFCKPKFKSK
jgi:hypothetical protein